MAVKQRLDLCITTQGGGPVRSRRWHELLQGSSLRPYVYTDICTIKTHLIIALSHQGT